MTDIRPNIWRLQATLDINGLVQALQDADPDIRKRATAALYALGSVDAVPAMRTALDNETDTEVRANLVTALAHLSAEDNVPAGKLTTQETDLSTLERMVMQLNSEQSERVIQAARVLGELKDKTAVEPLVIVFRNTALTGHARLAAAEALLALESAPAEVTLLGALRNPKWQLRRNAAAILGQLRADWAVVPLGQALHDEQDIVQRTARAALKRIGTREARNILAEGPKEGEYSDKLSTSETLALTNTPREPKPTDSPVMKALDAANAVTKITRRKGTGSLQSAASQLAAKLAGESRSKETPAATEPPQEIPAPTEPPQEKPAEQKKDDQI